MEQKLSDLFKTYFMKVKNIISFIQDRGVEYSRKEISLFSPGLVNFTRIAHFHIIIDQQLN